MAARAQGEASTAPLNGASGRKKFGRAKEAPAEKGVRCAHHGRERIQFQFQPHVPPLPALFYIPFHPFPSHFAAPSVLAASSCFHLSVPGTGSRQGQEERIATAAPAPADVGSGAPPSRSIRITGDGRCLFRSVAYGACLRRGKHPPSDSAQKELADELRAKVTDEFVKRRGDTEWFLEGNFENYVRQMRKPHAWGGEPELFMCSHVLRMPITVYMYTSSSDGPRIIAEYGQEYGKDDPVRVLYDGYGHYDALQPSVVRTQSRLRGV